MIILAIASLVLIAASCSIGKSADLPDPLAEAAKEKGRGYEAILSKISVVGAICFILCSLILVAME